MTSSMLHLQSSDEFILYNFPIIFSATLQVNSKAFKKAAEKWFSQHFSSSKSALDIKKLGVFIRFCCMPSSLKFQRAGCDWVLASPKKPVTFSSLLLGWSTPAASPRAGVASPPNGATPTATSSLVPPSPYAPIDFAFDWTSPALEPEVSFFEQMETENVELEFWLAIEHLDTAGQRLLESEVCLSRCTVPLKKLYAKLNAKEAQTKLELKEKLLFKLAPDGSPGSGSESPARRGSLDSTKNGDQIAAAAASGVVAAATSAHGTTGAAAGVAAGGPAAPSPVAAAPPSVGGVVAPPPAAPFELLSEIDAVLTLCLPDPEVLSLLYLGGLGTGALFAPPPSGPTPAELETKRQAVLKAEDEKRAQTAALERQREKVKFEVVDKQVQTRVEEVWLRVKRDHEAGGGSTSSSSGEKHSSSTTAATTHHYFVEYML